MACTPTTLGARYADSILTEGRIPEVDFGAIIRSQQDPSSAYNRQTLLQVTGKLNKLLPRTDLSDYPFLDSRRQQTYIFYPEIADFLNQSGYDINAVNDALGSYDIVVDQNPLFDNNSTIKVDQELVPEFVQNLFGQMEFYYAQNMANSVSGGFCSALSAPFGLISKILAGVSIFTNLKSLITDLVSSFGSKSLIDVLKDKLLEIVKKVKEAIEKQVEAIVQKFTSVINQLSAGVRNIEKRLKRMKKNIENFFSDFSIEKIGEKIGQFIDDSMDGFEELDGASIALLLFRFCQFAETLQSFLKGPVDGLRTFAASLAYEETLVNSLSKRETREAVRNGAVRLDDAGIEQGKNRITKGLAKNEESTDKKVAEAEEASLAVPSSIDVDTTPISDSVQQEIAPEVPLAAVYNSLNESGLTEDELSAIRSLTEKGVDGLFSFSSEVKEMGADSDVTDAQAGDGWSNIDQNVLIKLANVSKRLNKSLTIIRGYESAIYSKKAGRAINSFHKSGQYIQVSLEGASDYNIKNFVRVASQEGFMSIYVYPSGGYISLGMGMHRGGGGGVGQPKAYTRAHVRDEFRKGAKSSVW